MEPTGDSTIHNIKNEHEAPTQETNTDSDENRYTEEHEYHNNQQEPTEKNTTEITDNTQENNENINKQNQNTSNGNIQTNQTNMQDKNTHSQTNNIDDINQQNTDEIFHDITRNKNTKTKLKVTTIIPPTKVRSKTQTIQKRTTTRNIDNTTDDTQRRDIDILNEQIKNTYRSLGRQMDIEESRITFDQIQSLLGEKAAIYRKRYEATKSREDREVLVDCNKKIIAAEEAKKNRHTPLHMSLTHFHTMADMENDGQKDPKTYRDIENHPEKDQWTKSVEAELDNMLRLEVWEEKKRDEIPQDTQIIPTSWVFKSKKKEDGSVEEYKSRLVAGGNRQEPREDTHSPVAKPSTLKLILTIAAEENLYLYQADVKAAYLNAKIDSNIALMLPKGYHPKKTDSVLLLKKAIYGLKESGMLWYKELRSTLIDIGFTQSMNDEC